MSSGQILAFVESPTPRPNVFGSRRLRISLGQVGAVLPAWIEILAIPILSILIFAVLVIAEAGSRRRPEVHRTCFDDVEHAGKEGT